MKLKGHFKESEKTNYLNKLKMKKKNTCKPKEDRHSIETFIEAVNKDPELATKVKPRKLKSNLDKGERYS